MTTVRSLLQTIIERAPFTDPDSRYACEKAAQDALELLDEPVGEVERFEARHDSFHYVRFNGDPGKYVPASAYDSLLAKYNSLRSEVKP